MYKKITLTNGLRIVIAEMPYTHSVCTGIFTGVGSRYESDEIAGVSHLIEHLCFKGTTKRPTAKEISEAIESVGGLLNGGTDKELTVFWSKVAQPHLLLSLDVLQDMLRNSLFAQEYIQREKQVICEEINMLNDSPQQRVDFLIDELVWPQQPLGRDTAGSKESVCALTREQILHYFRSHYLPNNTVIGVAGNVNTEEVTQRLQEHFGDWKSAEVGKWSPANNNQDEPRIKVEKRDTEQINLIIALRGVPLTHPDRFALDLLNIILGEGMSSRLFLEIREKQGLAYDIHSSISHFLDSGSVMIYSGLAPGRLDDAIKSILEQINRIKEPITEQELNKAKEFAKGRMLLRMEDTRSVAGLVGVQEILLGNILTVDEIIAKIDSIQGEQINRVAQKLFITDKLNLAIVGPVEDGDRLLKLLNL